MHDFEGKVAVITGGASGLGLAMARRFGAAGMKLVIADIETGALADAEASLKAAGVEVVGHRTDVAESSELEALADLAYDRFGAVHILANNAGIGGSPGAMWELSEADWRWVIDVDLWSVIHGVRAFLPRMIASGQQGHVINTASVNSSTSNSDGPNTPLASRCSVLASSTRASSTRVGTGKRATGSRSKTSRPNEKSFEQRLRQCVRP